MQPVQVEGLSESAGMSAGICGIGSCRRGVLLGWNVRGQLGGGTTTDRISPVAVDGPEQAVTVAVGAVYSCALDEGDDAHCWGWNVQGRLGDGTRAESRPALTTSPPDEGRDCRHALACCQSYC